MGLNYWKLSRIIENNPEMFDSPFAENNPLNSYSYLEIRIAIGESLVAFFKGLQKLPK